MSDAKLEKPSEKGKEVSDDGVVKNESDGPPNLFEDWGMKYADQNAESVYSWGRD